MKNIIIISAIALSSVSGLRFYYGPNDQFNARREELLKANKDRLQTQWMNRIDNYDPDLDQEMATDIMNAEKRK